MQEITRQADYYGLPEQTRDPLPSQEKIAEQLAKPQPWQGPTRLADYGEVGSVQSPEQNIDKSVYSRNPLVNPDDLPGDGSQW